MVNNNVEMVNAWLYNNAKNAEQRARNEAVRISRIKAAEARAKLKAKRAQEAAKKAENQARQAAVERSKAEAAAERAARAAAISSGSASLRDSLCRLALASSAGRFTPRVVQDATVGVY